MISDRPTPADSPSRPDEQEPDASPTTEDRRRAAKEAADQVAATLRKQRHSVK